MYPLKKYISFLVHDDLYSVVQESLITWNKKKSFRKVGFIVANFLFALHLYTDEGL